MASAMWPFRTRVFWRLISSLTSPVAIVRVISVVPAKSFDRYCPAAIEEENAVLFNGEIGGSIGAVMDNGTVRIKSSDCGEAWPLVGGMFAAAFLQFFGDGYFGLPYPLFIQPARGT